jgi:hypothetical protein
MGLVDFAKRIIEEERYGGVPEPHVGVQVFDADNWKRRQIVRYCETAEQQGFSVEVASPEEAAEYREETRRRSGYRVSKRAWWVTVWFPGEPKPSVYDPDP